MTSSTRTMVAIFVALLVTVSAVVAWWLWGRGEDEQQPSAEAAVAPTPAPSPTPGLQERLSARLAGTTLATSDAIIRELASALSAHPKLAAWLASEDLARRFVAAVDRVADGLSPGEQLDFARPSGPFAVREEPDGSLVIDPASFARYDLAAEIFASLDTAGAVALYRELEPVIDDAYAEIAPPGARFADRLDAAFDELLAVPRVSGPAEVQQLVVTYAWADRQLEALSEAQRHLLRTGPDNVAKLQHKLGELRAALAASGSG
jgi:hypothetical protein